MSFMDFFKAKKKEGVVEEFKKFPDKKELDLPPAPPPKEEMPVFPSSIGTEDDAFVAEVKAELEEKEELTTKPLFIYLDSYREIINETGMINSTFKEASNSLARVAKIKEEEDKEFNKWENQLKDIQKKLTYVDRTLFTKVK